MPSPIAHLAVGYAIYRIYRPSVRETDRCEGRSNLRLLLTTAIFSMLPDLDAIAGIVFSDMLAYHNNLTHSLMAGVIIGLVTGACVWMWRRSDFWRWFVLAAVSYNTHVVLDYFTHGRGVMLFWPVSFERYAAPFSLFVGVRWDYGLVNVAHLWTMTNELLFAAFTLLIVQGIARARVRRFPRPMPRRITTDGGSANE